jgi:hypothetical protein
MVEDSIGEVDTAQVGHDQVGPAEGGLLQVRL